jgi:hypothetical protein
MTTHYPDEQLSAYLDGEVEADEREQIDSHLKSCPECSGRLEGMRSAMAAMSALPEVAPTSDETRALRQVLIDKKPRGSLVARRAWTLAGGLALIVAAFVGFLVLGPSGRRDFTASPSRQAKTVASTAMSSPEEVAAAVNADSEVKANLGRYKVSDVPKQEQSLQAFDDVKAAQPAAAPQSESSAQSKAEPAAGTASPTTEPQKSLGTCLRAWLARQKLPTIPITGKAIEYQGRPAWLLIYAYSRSTSAESPLNLIQVYIVSRANCDKEESLIQAQIIRPSPSP